MIAVITGASSGIGRATAFEFARKGYDLVLAARFGAGLEEVAQECNSLGGRALAIPTDVAKEEDVNALAAQARESFGGFDVWVNNAAVGLFGHFEEIPTEDIRQLMEINLFGSMYGARAAIRQFRSQGYGTLINVSSMVALVGQPFSIPYTTSKFAIRGMSISLSQELADEEDIHVCCVMPAVIDTPIFQHAGNYMGNEVKAPKPVIPAKRVARTIYRLTKKPQEQVTVGNMSRLMRFQRLVSPAQLFDKYMQKMIATQHFKKKPSRPYQGNLYEPLTNWNKVNGGWIPEKKGLTKGTAFAAVAGLTVAGALGAAYYSRLKNHPRPVNQSPARTWPPVHPEPSLRPDPISGTHRGSTLERQQNNTAGLHSTTIITHGSPTGITAGPTSGITGNPAPGTTGNPGTGTTGHVGSTDTGSLTSDNPASGVTGTHTGGLGGETEGLSG